MSNQDFNGDGISDILWRHDDGRIGTWLGTASGQFQINNASLVNVSNDWDVFATGDFNNDGRTDILWRHSNGTIGNWLGTASGGFQINNASIVAVPNDWNIVGIGDFNGDGADDILWRHDNGTVGNWLGTANGQFTINSSSLTGVSSDWHVAGTGDFNGDGLDDILWQSNDGWVGTWSGTEAGNYIINDANLDRIRVSIVAVGDFNGDHRSDILLVDDWSFYSVVLAGEDGAFALGVYEPFGDASFGQPPIAVVGDYNGDGIDDLLMRSVNGDLTYLLGNGNGYDFTATDLVYNVPNEWHVKPNDSGAGIWDY